MTANPDYTAADHDRRGDDAYAAAKYRLTLKWLGRFRPPTGPLYNIGCGGGLFNAMAVAAGYDVLAFEPDSSAFEIAAARNLGPRCRTENFGLMDIAEREGAAVVVMHDVLEHIEDDESANERVFTLLRPGGLLVASVPALPSLFGFHDEQLGHFRRYTRRSFDRLLASRFEVRRMRYFGMTFIPVTLYFSRIRRTPYRSSGAGDLVARAFDAVCRVEEHVSVPIGTSLMALAVRS